jgi:hypothetical protein
MWWNRSLSQEKRPG